MWAWATLTSSRTVPIQIWTANQQRLQATRSLSRWVSKRIYESRRSSRHWRIELWISLANSTRPRPIWSWSSARSIGTRHRRSRTRRPPRIRLNWLCSISMRSERCARYDILWPDESLERRSGPTMWRTWSSNIRQAISICSHESRRSSSGT